MSFGLLKSVQAPSFNIYGGVSFAKQQQSANMNFPFSSSELVIKSGTFARIVAGNISEGNGNTVGYVIGGSAAWTCKITVDIKNSTKISTHTFDVNFIVGGQTDGSIYGNNQINIKNGSVGRVLRW